MLRRRSKGQGAKVSDPPASRSPRPPRRTVAGALRPVISSVTFPPRLKPDQRDALVARAGGMADHGRDVAGLAAVIESDQSIWLPSPAAEIPGENSPNRRPCPRPFRHAAHVSGVAAAASSPCVRMCQARLLGVASSNPDPESLRLQDSSRSRSKTTRQRSPGGAMRAGIV